MELEFVYLPTSVYFTPSSRSSIKSVILHSTDGRKSGDLSVLLGKTNRKVSCHWYVDRRGRCYHLLDHKNIAWHVGPASQPAYSNANSIGIEQEHLDFKDDWPDEQVLSTAKLCAYLRGKYGNIPILSHAEVAVPKGRKVDPVGFPWKTFSKYVSENIGIRLKEVKSFS